MLSAGIVFTDLRSVETHSRITSIGLYNYTRELHGVQIGFLNAAQNNPVWARALPVLNLNL